jgi:hypothetical protein
MRMVVGGMIGVALGTGATAQSTEKTRNFDFAYSYPAVAARTAPLHVWLEADRARLRAETARDASSDRAESQKGGFPFRPYDIGRTWKLVTDTPRFVSLSGESWAYTGGAHGNTNTLSLVWDKKAGRKIGAAAMFDSPAALQALFGTQWCAWRRTERSKRIGSDSDKDDFFKCPPIKDLTVLLGSSDGRKINRIGLIADQYVAGSYAEGPYEMTLPVTTAVLRRVKLTYRNDFAIR